MSKPDAPLVMFINGYRRVPEIETFDATGGSSCLGCAHDYNVGYAEDGDSEAVYNRTNCRNLKNAVGGHAPCQGSVWIEDNDEAKAAYVAMRLEMA